MTTKDSKSSGAENAIREFLELAAKPPAPGAGIPDGASSLMKNLWFSWNRLHIGFEWLLKSRCKKLRPRAQILLEWAMTECYAMDGLPQEVCVDMAVEHARKVGGREEAGFVNAVLRRLLREAGDLNALKDMLKSAPAYVQCQLPQKLYERWCARHGVDWTMELAELLQKPAKITARRRGSLAGLQSPLTFDDAVSVFEESDDGFDPSRFYLQDPSTMMAPAMLDPRPGEKIGDLCASPGGKSVAIAERMAGQGLLYSSDCAEGRLKRLRENLASCAIAVVELQDATQPTLPKESFDGVLLDVPCSNTGVIRRRPDVRRNFQLANFDRLCKLQREILDGACGLVRPGGRLIYSTCSIDDDENVRQAENFLKRHKEFVLEEQRQLYPSEAHDGAFAARFKRI